MDVENNLSSDVARHRQLREAMPRVWNAFFGSFRSLRPIQLEAMPPILAGSNTLVTAPTAGGKTEAVLAPLCERLTRERWDGLSILVVTPTRALVNDLFARLERPLDALGIRLGRKTGDHAFTASREQVLITTPESVESLLMLRKQALACVRAVALDEIHLLDGAARGDHLRALLARLSVYRAHSNLDGQAALQRIAMSATVATPRRLADAYLGVGATVVSVPGQRSIKAQVITANGSDKERAEAAIAAVESGWEAPMALTYFDPLLLR